MLGACAHRLALGLVAEHRRAAVRGAAGDGRDRGLHRHVPVYLQSVEGAGLPDAAAAGSATVDVFIATYSEDPELVRFSIRDAKRMTYPHPIDLRVHVCDDGRRPEMRARRGRRGRGHITRTGNEGYKAGNLRHAVEHTSGEFIVICDADTRVFPTLLERTLGYFRDPDVAWVQTPQWFYDLPEGLPLSQAWRQSHGRLGGLLERAIERVLGEVRVGEDPFCNDARFFYDVLQRRRNWANASFCCGCRVDPPARGGAAGGAPALCG